MCAAGGMGIMKVMGHMSQLATKGTQVGEGCSLTVSHGEEQAHKHVLCDESAHSDLAIQRAGRPRA